MFETGIILFLLLAMLKTEHPKQWAIGVILISLMFTRVIEAHGLYWAESITAIIPGLTIGNPRWIAPNLMVLAQLFFALYLISCMSWVRGKDSRNLFLLMAGFLVASSLLFPLYKYDAIRTFSAYTLLYRIVDVCMVLTVFYHSNGIRQIIGNIRSSIFQHNSGIVSFQSVNK